MLNSKRNNVMNLANAETESCHDSESCDNEYQENELSEDNEQSVCVRQLRDRSKLKRTDFYGYPIAVLANAEPINYEEAINSDNAEKWKTMNEEMKSLQENNTF